MEIIAKELQLDEGHPDVHRLFLAIYKSFMEVLNFAHLLVLLSVFVNFLMLPVIV